MVGDKTLEREVVISRGGHYKGTNSKKQRKKSDYCDSTNKDISGSAVLMKKHPLYV